MFEINNSKDRLTQLEANFQLYRNDSLNVSLAEQLISDSWHLGDWILTELKADSSTISNQDFRSSLYEDCPEMKILHDLANSIKHKELTNPKVKIIRTENQQGDFSSDYSSDYDISRLEVHLENGFQIDVEELIEIAIYYWSGRIN